MFSPWLPYRIRSAFDMTFSAVYEIGFRKPLFQKMIKNNYTMLLLILAKSIQQYKVILFYDSLKRKEVIMVPYHDIALYDDKKAGRRQSFKNSQTARTSAPSIYLLCSRNNDLGGNWRSILFAMSRAFLFAEMNDLREDDFFRLVFRMGGKFCSFELFSI